MPATAVECTYCSEVLADPDDYADHIELGWCDALDLAAVDGLADDDHLEEGTHTCELCGDTDDLVSDGDSWLCEDCASDDEGDFE